MPGFFKEHLRPLAGSAGLHLALLAILAGAALHWTSSQPPVELAIEGYVVDSAPPDRPATKSQRVEPSPKPQGDSVPPPEPAAEEATQRRAQEAAAAGRAAREQREADQRAERAAAERRRAAEDAEAQRRAEETEARRQAAENDAQRQAAEREAKRKAEAEEVRRKAEAAAEAERDAALQRRLAAEEEAGAAVSAGVMDEYRRMLAQTIERSWIRPLSARAGLQCTLLVTQAPGGTVMDVTLGACNGDAAVRESITNAVYRASPLPAPRDPRAFERRLEIVFKPTE